MEQRWSRRLLVTLTTAGTLLAGYASTAEAAPVSALDSQVAQVMAAVPGGVRTAPNQISWKNGHVVLTLAAPSATAAKAAAVPATSGTGACGSNFWCLYENANFNQGLFNDGRMLSLTGCDGIPGNLTNYGFNDKTSSWFNNSGFSPVNVYRDINGGGGILWTMHAFERSSYVGDSNNDKASSINC